MTNDEGGLTRMNILMNTSSIACKTNSAGSMDGVARATGKIRTASSTRSVFFGAALGRPGVRADPSKRYGRVGDPTDLRGRAPRRGRLPSHERRDSSTSTALIASRAA